MSLKKYVLVRDQHLGAMFCFQQLISMCVLTCELEPLHISFVAGPAGSQKSQEEASSLDKHRVQAWEGTRGVACAVT